MADISNFDDVIDVRDLIARVEELEDMRADVREDAEQAANEALNAASELADLRAILAELKGNGGDEQWRGDWYPVALIRDSYFVEYARELVEDCDYLPKGFPSFIEIDWQATARNVRMDYASVEFDGVTYWYR